MSFLAAFEAPFLFANFTIEFVLWLVRVWSISDEHIVALRVWAFLNIWVFVADPFPLETGELFKQARLEDFSQVFD